MKFMKGGDLFSHLLANGQFAENIVKFFAMQIALGLGYLHDHQILYRDLKLENILVEDTGYLKLIDFGVSKKLDLNVREKTFSIRGTPEYYAPEML